ncbi:MAG: DUF1501 domain-containing protein [Planctomycetaceae bacterium]
MTRRELLRIGAVAPVGLSLADVLRLEARGQSAGAPAKSIILLWLWGGPSHIDTLDLKPHAPVEYRGPYEPIETAVPGVRICELLPRIARRADKLSILRSLHTDSNDHGIAGTIGLTGDKAGAISLGGVTQAGALRPTHGSIVSRISGFTPDMPRFVAIGQHLHQGHKPIAGEAAAALGPMHDPFRMDYQPRTGVQLPSLELLDGVTASGLDHRAALRTQLDLTARRVESSLATSRLDEFYQQAFALLTSPASRAVFDLEQESPSLRRRYGRFRFGQCCLLARRLVEAGVRFVQVNWSSHVEPIEDTGDGGWDMHDRYFQQYQDRHAWMLDQSLSALLDDLSERGLLEETIVIALGEFGRTPRINGKAGRDHWHHCYSGLVAGGGLRAGQVIGESDKQAEYPVVHPITPADVFTTALQQMGIGTPQLTEAGLLPKGEIIEGLV